VARIRGDNVQWHDHWRHDDREFKLGRFEFRRLHVREFIFGRVNLRKLQLGKLWLRKFDANDTMPRGR
jgi:hypothetical protein